MALAVGYALGVAHGRKIALAVGNFKGDTLEKMDRMMTYQLFIDDERFTADGSTAGRSPAPRMRWLRFLRLITLPPSSALITGDGDLGALPDTSYAAGLPEDFRFDIHSQNPVGAANIRSLLNNYLKFRQG